MKRIALLGGVVVLLLAIPLAVTAQEPGPPEDLGPPESPVFATIQYVDQLIAAVYAYVDGQIAAVLGYVGQEVARLDARIDGIGGGEAGPDFEVPGPEKWGAEILTAERRLVLRTSWIQGDTCTWNGVPLVDWAMESGPIGHPWMPVYARGRATHGGNVLGYGVGTCGGIQFDELVYVPGFGETIQVDIWLFWMGREKSVTVPITIVSNPPVCKASYFSGLGDLQAFLEASAYDPEGGELTYLWDFGDGTTAEGGPQQVHTYPSPGVYTVGWTAVDDAGLECDYWYYEIVDVY